MEVVNIIEIEELSESVDGYTKPIFINDYYLYDKKSFSKTNVYNFLDFLYNLKNYDFSTSENLFELNYDIKRLKGNFILINKFRRFKVSFRFTKALLIEGEFFRLDKIEVSNKISNKLIK